MDGYRTKLRTSDHTTLDANGNGQVLMSPDSASTSWDVTRIAVRTNQDPATAPFPQAELYDTIIATQSSSYGATASGNNDVFDVSGFPIEIGPNDAILIVWTGGIPDSVATATIRGYKYLGNA